MSRCYIWLLPFFWSTCSSSTWSLIRRRPQRSCVLVSPAPFSSNCITSLRVGRFLDICFVVLVIFWLGPSSTPRRCVVSGLSEICDQSQGFSTHGTSLVSFTQIPAFGSVHCLWHQWLWRRLADTPSRSSGLSYALPPNWNISLRGEWPKACACGSNVPGSTAPPVRLLWQPKGLFTSLVKDFNFNLPSIFLPFSILFPLSIPA